MLVALTTRNKYKEFNQGNENKEKQTKKIKTHRLSTQSCFIGRKEICLKKRRELSEL